jgi:glyoxylase-like metal-dependent hydrolase (beta-lactamase superfamily II)
MSAAITSDLFPGVPVRVAPAVQRVVAPNASALTGPGTNSYVLGDPPCAILDPGPDDPGHLEALLGCVPGPRWVFCTHTHRDHSPLARRIARRTGARLVGRAPPGDGRQDESFAPDEQPLDDQAWPLDGATLRAIGTPGHASNHVCYLLEPGGLLFSGDHILDGVTPVILAPDGDMQAYLASLARLRAYPIERIAPGHGRVLTQPLAVIDAIVAHRAAREARVVAALPVTCVGATLEELLPVVYAEVARGLWPMARLSLTASLVKLEREGRARRDGERWQATGAA